MQLLELLGVTFASWQSSNAPRSARALDQADVPPPALAALLLDAGWAAHPIGDLALSLTEACRTRIAF